MRSARPCVFGIRATLNKPFPLQIFPVTGREDDKLAVKSCAKMGLSMEMLGSRVMNVFLSLFS